MPKSKRQSRKVSSRSTAPASNVSAKSASGASLYEREFNPDYSQTLKDLRRIGLLAGSFLSLLVILSFFLR